MCAYTSHLSQTVLVAHFKVADRHVSILLYIIQWNLTICTQSISEGCSNCDLYEWQIFFSDKK